LLFIFQIKYNEYIPIYNIIKLMHINSLFGNKYIT